MTKTSPKSARDISEIYLECLQNLPGSPQNLLGMCWVRPTSPQVPNEVPKRLRVFPSGPQVLETRGRRLRGIFFFGAGTGPCAT